MKTIAQAWAKYSAAIMPPGSSNVQIFMMREAFYAGFLSSLKQVSFIDDNMLDDEIDTSIDNWMIECENVTKLRGTDG